jgi:hypothetical protein
VCKETQVKSMVPGERLYIDISSVRASSFGGYKFWVLIVDDFTDMCWSIFVKAKSLMPEQVVMLIKSLRFRAKIPE